MHKAESILALDLGTKTGWALGRTEDFPSHRYLVCSGVLDFSLKRGESSGMLFLKFGSWLRSIHSEYEAFDLVVYEQPHHRGGYATQVLLGMVGILQELCEVWSSHYVAVHTSTLKKFATGRGRGVSKANMVEVAASRFGRELSSHDEADALLLWLWGKENYG